MKNPLPFPSEKNRLTKSMLVWTGLLGFFLFTFNQQSWMFPYQSWLDSLVTGLHELLNTIGFV